MLGEYLINTLGFAEGLETLFDLDNNPSTSADNLEVWKWFRQGGTDEDTDSRFLNHFHDPINTAPWTNAGLPFQTSALVWAQGVAPGDNASSWLHARNSFYNALKSGDEHSYAETFQTIGQLTHLVADATVPAHVRNDIHPLAANKITKNWSPHYEVFAEDHSALLDYSGIPVDLSLTDLAIANVDGAPCPISALWDTDTYSGDNPEATIEQNGAPGFVGAAEYTNANFLSEDTAFSNYNFPAKQETNFSSTVRRVVSVMDENQKAYQVEYLYRDMANLTPLDEYKIAAVSFLKNYLPTGAEQIATYTYLDDEVLKGYTEKLVPAAVGYSTALIDYLRY